jgi:hypothetical protein
MTTPISRIIGADICRDGGSYSFCFYSDDSQWYEFFLRTRAFENAAPASHFPPVIYLGSANDDKVVDRLSWDDGRNFLDGVEYDNERFRELVAIVKAEGKS